MEIGVHYATSPTATSSHIHCTKTVTKLLSQRNFLLCTLLGVSIVQQQCILSLVYFKEINECLFNVYLVAVL